MAERIIPIQIEGRDEPSPPEPDKEENKLSKCLEDLKVDPGKALSAESSLLTEKEASSIKESPPQKVKVKPAPVVSNTEQEYLKKFDVLEKRDGNMPLAEYTYPNSDVQERIVLVIDRAQDENFTPFTVGSQKYTPLSMMKRAISIFIKLKLGINPNHQFAIIVMNENQAELEMVFTNDSKKLIDLLNRITECETEDKFSLNSVFKYMEEISLPELQPAGLTPNFVMRMIVFYGRSYTIPEISMTEKLQALLDHPYFICDILMTHEPVGSSNYCQKIFEILQSLDQKGVAYFFPVCRDMKRMHKYTGKLLAHPFQRPIQMLVKN